MDSWLKNVFVQYADGHPAEEFLSGVPEYERKQNSRPHNRYTPDKQNVPEKHEYADTFLNLCEYFYNGNKNDEVADALSQIDKIDYMQHVSSGNFYDSIDYAYLLTKQLRNEDIDKKQKQNDQGKVSDFELELDIQGAVTAEDFQEELEEQEGDMRQAAALLEAAGVGEGDNPDVAEESIQLRNEVFTKMKTDPAFQHFLDCFGQIMSYMSDIRRENYTENSFALSGVEQGNDIPYMLSGDLAKAADPELQEYFDFKYYKRQLWQFDKQDTENTGRSDVAILVDKSHSMSNPPKNYPNFVDDDANMSKMDLASSFAVAMFVMLKNQDRNFKLFTFDRKTNKLFDSDEDDFGEKFHDVIDIGARGGTNTQKALETCFHDNDYDTIVITDGQDTLNEDELWMKGDRRVSCISFNKKTGPEFYDSFVEFTDEGLEHEVVEEFK